MSASSPIPPDYRTLVGLLRCAVKREAPEASLLEEADWPAVFRQAQQHGVDTYLYPWLAKHAPARFSAHADAPADAAPAAWRALFLKALPRTLLRQRQLSELFGAASRAGIRVIPLKGAWLSETVYDDPVQRSMSDLDILVRECDVEAFHRLLTELGYRARSNVLFNSFFKDQEYVHPDHPYAVEVHWRFTPVKGSDVLGPEPDLVWGRSQPAVLLGQPIFALSPSDTLAHLGLHILLHNMAMPLRGYLDLALLALRSGPELDLQSVSRSAEEWHQRRSVGFALSLTASLFDLALPDVLARVALPLPLDRLSLAFDVLTKLPEASDRQTEARLVQLSSSSFAARLQLLWRRIFLPRELLATLYPCARRPAGLPLGWALRLRDLLARYCCRINRSFRPTSAERRKLEAAAAREELRAWLLNDKEPG